MCLTIYFLVSWVRGGSVSDHCVFTLLRVEVIKVSLDDHYAAARSYLCLSKGFMCITNTETKRNQGVLKI